MKVQNASQYGTLNPLNSRNLEQLALKGLTLKTSTEHILPWTTAAGWSQIRRRWCRAGAWWRAARPAADTGNTPGCRQCISSRSAAFSIDTNSNKTTWQRTSPSYGMIWY